jgi:hypothetical protein
MLKESSKNILYIAIIKINISYQYIFYYLQYLKCHNCFCNEHQVPVIIIIIKILLLLY